jgi:diguanylate cyclase
MSSPPPTRPADAGEPALTQPLPLARWSVEAGEVRVVVMLVTVLAGATALVALGFYALLGDIGDSRAALAAALATFIVSTPLALLLFKFARQIERLRLQLSRFVETAGPGVVPAPRAQFVAIIEREWARARRYGTGAAILLIEVDRYLRTADAHGSGATAALLDAMERSTRHTLRGGDALASWSESQIAVFLANADAMGAIDAAERIREALEQIELAWQGQVIRATVSIGVATLRPAHQHLQALLDDATIAVLAARQAGGNCVRAAPIDAPGLQSPGSSIDDNQAAGPL